MGTAGNKLIALLPVAALTLVTACAPLSIGPPTPDKQTLLVLPAEVVLDAQHRNFGFAFAYEITGYGYTDPPYRALFKLPVKNDMVIVDSLPPGNYRVTRLLTIPLSVGDKTFNTQGRPADIRFRLEAGKITIATQSLYVRTFNAIPGRGLSTTYESRIRPTTGIQRLDILARLEALDNFSAWEVLGGYESRASQSQAGKQYKQRAAPEKFQGEWEGFWRPVSVAGTEICIDGALNFEIGGSRLEGKGVDDQGNQYRITASLLDEGVIRGKLSLNRRRVAKVTGKLYDDGSILGSFDYGEDCQAEWKARKI